MTVAYWIVAALLASLYLYSGGLKVLRSPDQLRPMMGWIDTVPLRLVRTIGVLEVLGALGLILPPLTGIAPLLALAAAIGLVLIQVGGIASVRLALTTLAPNPLPGVAEASTAAVLPKE